MNSGKKKKKQTSANYQLHDFREVCNLTAYPSKARGKKMKRTKFSSLQSCDSDYIGVPDNYLMRKWGRASDYKIPLDSR